MFLAIFQLYFYSIWTIGIVMYIFCNWITYLWMFGSFPNQLTSSLVYPAILLQWTTILTILLWLCLTGNGGFVNKFLSHKLWRPLSRLSYSIYLTHPWVIAIVLGSKREPIWPIPISILNIWATVLVLSLLLAVLFSALFEVPLFRMMNRVKGDTIKKQETFTQVPLEIVEKPEISRNSN